MESGYQYADLKKDKHESIEKISRLERELSEKVGQDIVLIAYAEGDRKQ